MAAQISVNNLAFPTRGIAEDLANWRDLGTDSIAILSAKLEAGGWSKSIDAVRASGLRVTTLIHPTLASVDRRERWAAERDAAVRALEAAKSMGAPSVYGLPGGAGRMSFEEAAEAFCEAVAPVAAHARSIGVAWLLEPSNPLYHDFAFAHSLADLVPLAERSRLGVCIDIFACFTEANLEATIRRAAPRCSLVQVSDYIPGDRQMPCRTVVGEGIIPLERILGWIVGAGYAGPWDLELIGPRIEAAGPAEAARRSVMNMRALLDRLEGRAIA